VLLCLAQKPELDCPKKFPPQNALKTTASSVGISVLFPPHMQPVRQDDALEMCTVRMSQIVSYSWLHTLQN
jgi:hypothetical protein